MNQSDLDKLTQILSGIEKKKTVERISGKVINKNSEIIEIQQESSLDPDGGINDKTEFKLHLLSCGCVCQGRYDIGGVDWKGNVTCKRHFWRCHHCHRPLSPLTVRVINGVTYCAFCYWKIKFFGHFVKIR